MKFEPDVIYFLEEDIKDYIDRMIEEGIVPIKRCGNIWWFYNDEKIERLLRDMKFKGTFDGIYEFKEKDNLYF